MTDINHHLERIREAVSGSINVSVVLRAATRVKLTEASISVRFLLDTFANQGT